MPSGGSLTADQWLLLATVYGPIVIPQLWSKCLPTDLDDQILHQRATMVQRAEADKETGAAQKAQDKKSLADAKKIGKDAWEVEKTRIANNKVAAAEAKTQEKLRLASLKQVEKVWLAAEKKVKAAERKAGKRKATSQTVDDLLEGQVRPPPPPPTAGPKSNRELLEAVHSTPYNHQTTYQQRRLG